jgi:PhnB protein
MQINPYLTFNGECEAAFKLYERCFGGKIEAMLKHQDLPAGEKAPPDLEGKILHAMMKVKGQTLMGSDACAADYVVPKGMHVSVHIEDKAEAERVFAGLAEGGNVAMPMQETFWAVSFGILTDQFGIPWMVNCPKPM